MIYLRLTVVSFYLQLIQTMKDYYALALEAHKKTKGKLSVKTLMPIETKEDLAIAYTPGVAAVSKAIFENPSLAKELTMKGRTIAVISNGTAVLGLGDIGALAGLPVMEGKAILFKELGGVDAIPLVIDEKDTEKFIEIVQKVSVGFGGINLEDIAAPACFEIEKRLKNMLDIPVVHDDQHGTAIVVLAALINALKLVNKKKEEVKIVLSGAGAAGIAIAKLLLAYGMQNIVLCDSKGIVYEGRPDSNQYKNEIIRASKSIVSSGTIKDALKGADVFLGLSKPQILTPEDVSTMNKDAIIFAMANPEPEIYPEDAKKGGARIVATGRSDFPNQINNSLAFPGLFKGALEKNLVRLDETHFMKAAIALANAKVHPTEDALLPDALDHSVPGIIAGVL